MSAFDAFRLEVGLPTVDEMVNRPSWTRDGACIEHPAVNFYPAKGESFDEAKAVCRSCVCGGLSTGNASGSPNARRRRLNARISSSRQPR